LVFLLSLAVILAILAVMAILAICTSICCGSFAPVLGFPGRRAAAQSNTHCRADAPLLNRAGAPQRISLAVPTRCVFKTITVSDLWHGKCTLLPARLDAQLSKSSPERERNKFMGEVLLYLLEHTGAMDTSEGIVQWWLPAGSSYSQEQVQEVLDELVRRNWLVTRGSMEQFRLYGLNKKSMPEILKFLAQRGEAGEI
ncbi:MAG TPA: hypothetical protein VNV88_12980, partial [Candidatus Solibacter sp.]|nr:hypothetical protein [Candidatus Solibacter sp.]